MATPPTNGARSPDRAQTEVLVVVVTFNSSEVLKDLLDALPAAIGDVPCVTTVVVDNASGDESADLAEESSLEPIVIRCPENRGYASGINVALEAVSPTRALLVLNADARPNACFLAELLKILESRNGPLPTGIVAPRVVDRLGNLKFSLRRRPTVLRALGEALMGGRRAARFAALGEQIQEPKSYADGRIADWATGAALLISADCLQEVGPWDESFFLYSEETDYAMRAKDAGFVLRYARHAIVEHRGGQMSKSPYLWSIGAVNRVRLYQRRHGHFAGATYRLSVILNEAIRAPLNQTHRSALWALVRDSRPGPKPTQRTTHVPAADVMDQSLTRGHDTAWSWTSRLAKTRQEREI